MKTPAVEPVLRSRLLPRISFRVMFVLVTLAAFLASLARVAGGGAALAIGVLVAVIVIIACFAAMAVTFLVTWLFAMLTYRGETDELRGSPFATDQLPPQIIPPREREP